MFGWPLPNSQLSHQLGSNLSCLVFEEILKLEIFSILVFEIFSVLVFEIFSVLVFEIFSVPRFKFIMLLYFCAGCSSEDIFQHII